jgi:tetratricopeptide (TPR) repeat protein
VERIFLDVDQGDRIRAVRVRDAQGNESRFEFTSIRENVGLPTGSSVSRSRRAWRWCRDEPRLGGGAGARPGRLRDVRGVPRGEKAERREEYDRAVLEYAKAVQEVARQPRVQESLERARLRSSQEHAFAARRLASRALYKEALDELRLALDLNPASRRSGPRRTTSSSAGTPPPPARRSSR